MARTEAPPPANRGPLGDECHHRPFGELESAFAGLAVPPVGEGRLELIVLRRADGVREMPHRAWLAPQSGVPGDDWSRRPPRDPEAELAVMRRDVAELIANGQELTLFGDNLFVYLDISSANLPVGTHLRVGEAVVCVTAKPHNGCAKFRQRFGADALRWVNDPPIRSRNLRGIYWKVIAPGAIHVGAPIEVSPPEGADPTEGE